jgi:hypothetical protein
VRLKEWFIDFSHNMALLMETLMKKFGPFKEVGESNSKFGLHEKSRDSEYLEKE